MSASDVPGASEVTFTADFDDTPPPHIETRELLSHLDGLLVELSGRAEYCDDGDEALASQGDWALHVEE